MPRRYEPFHWHQGRKVLGAAPREGDKMLNRYDVQRWCDQNNGVVLESNDFTVKVQLPANTHLTPSEARAFAVELHKFADFTSAKIIKNQQAGTTK